MKAMKLLINLICAAALVGCNSVSAKDRASACDYYSSNNAMKINAGIFVNHNSMYGIDVELPISFNGKPFLTMRLISISGVEFEVNLEHFYSEDKKTILATFDLDKKIVQDGVCLSVFYADSQYENTDTIAQRIDSSNISKLSVRNKGGAH